MRFYNTRAKKGLFLVYLLEGGVADPAGNRLAPEGQRPRPTTMLQRIKPRMPRMTRMERGIIRREEFRFLSCAPHSPFGFPIRYPRNPRSKKSSDFEISASVRPGRSLRPGRCRSAVQSRHRAQRIAGRYALAPRVLPFTRERQTLTLRFSRPFRVGVTAGGSGNDQSVDVRPGRCHRFVCPKPPPQLDRLPI